MRQTFAAVVLLLLAACPAIEGEIGPQGPEGPEGPAGYSPLQSGTRIKARVGTTSDGAKLFLGWHDAELGVDCEFLKADDGQTRCLPFGPTVQGWKVFSDSACTKHVVRLAPADAESSPTYARSNSEDGLSLRAWRLIGTSPPPAFGVWPDGSCAAYESSVDDGWFSAQDVTLEQPALSVSVE